jgi:hypothetical protein
MVPVSKVAALTFKEKLVPSERKSPGAFLLLSSVSPTALTSTPVHPLRWYQRKRVGVPFIFGRGSEGFLVSKLV